MSARASEALTREPRAPRQRHLRAVRRRSRGLIKRRPSRRVAPAAVCVAIFVVATVFGVLLEQVLIAQSAFKLSRIRSELTKAEARHQELLFSATRLESPGRIENYARDVLGMVEPAEIRYVVADVPAGASARVARAPRRALVAPTGTAAGP